MSREKEEKHFVPQPEPRRRDPEPDPRHRYPEPPPKRERVEREHEVEAKAVEPPPVATTRDVKDGSWISNRFRR
jgi:hypothetical protein